MGALDSEGAIPQPVEVPPEPLFALDLGDNGGLLAPRTAEELHSWAESERVGWDWANGTPTGGHRSDLDAALQQLRSATKQASAAKGMTDDGQRASHIANAKSSIEDVFIGRRLPHSSTLLWKRIDELRREASDNAAAAYLCVRLAPKRKPRDFDVRDLGSLQGLAIAANELFGSSPDAATARATEKTIDGHVATINKMVGDQRLSLDALKREQAQIRGAIASEHDNQQKTFGEASAARQQKHDKDTEEYKQALENLRKTFREELALRAPAQYWRDKMIRRGWAAAGFGVLSLALMAWVIYALATDLPQLGLVFKVTTVPAAPGTSPPVERAIDHWRVGELILAGVFVVWVIRLLVRIFLSQLHLSQDAAERVTMVTTYLSLQEGGKLDSEKDRSIILGSLFRPATDGIVKDEGLPPSLHEVFTRTGKSS